MIEHHRAHRRKCHWHFLLQLHSPCSSRSRTSRKFKWRMSGTGTCPLSAKEASVAGCTWKHRNWTPPDKTFCSHFQPPRGIRTTAHMDKFSGFGRSWPRRQHNEATDLDYHVNAGSKDQWRAGRFYIRCNPCLVKSSTKIFSKNIYIIFVFFEFLCISLFGYSVNYLSLW